MKLSKILALLMMASLVAVAGCGSSDDDDDISAGGSKGGSTAAAPAAALGTASISGKVTLTGKAPIAAKIAFDADPVCKSQHTGTANDETVVSDANGNLANVFVYVKDAPNTAAPSTPVVLTQHGCMYSPHVFGIQVNQTMQIVNDDQTLHNIHCLAAVNDSFNVGQPTQGMKTEKKFGKAEVLVPFKCDVHGWMHCFGGVVNNSFFSVSGADGGFKITQLPAGSYTLVAVHEKYGVSEEKKVTVTDGASQTVDFTFAAK